MTDLTKITTPYGLLDDKTREALKAHGGPYEFWRMLGAEFSPVEEPSWGAGAVYRVAPPAKDSINWDHVSDDFICMARDKDGMCCLYFKRPALTGCHWTGRGVRSDTFTSYKRGTCNWEGSLVFRPGHEPKGKQNDE
jgi:hypothetical protein